MEKQRLCPMPRVFMGKISEITTVGTGPNPVAKAQAKSDVLQSKRKSSSAVVIVFVRDISTCH